MLQRNIKVTSRCFTNAAKSLQNRCTGGPRGCEVVEARRCHDLPFFPRPTTTTTAARRDALAHAEALCVKRGERLTPMRRHVLEVLAASHKPLGAYEIIDRWRRAGRARRRSRSTARSIS